MTGTDALTQQEFDGLAAALGQLVDVEAVLTRDGHRRLTRVELVGLLSTRDPGLAAAVDGLWEAMARVRAHVGVAEGNVPLRLGSGGNLL